GLNELTMEQLRLQFRNEPETPFFLYIATQSPHEPLVAPQALIDKYRSTYNRPLEDLWRQRVSRLRTLGLFPSDAPTQMPQFTRADRKAVRASAATRAAMIEWTDTEFGRLLQFLEQSGKLDNTLIIVASDNGASSPTSKLTNAPYRGAKALLNEGGTLSPLVARWPAGNLRVNDMTDSMTTYLDLLPTFLHVAGVSYPALWRDTPLRSLEGRNLLPLLRGESLPPPENFFWSLYGRFAVLHRGRWKLFGNSTYDEKRERRQAEPTLALFDLSSDPAETKNLAGKEKQMAAALLESYGVWAQLHGAVPYYQVLDAYRKSGAIKATGPQD
ncbi:MAG TPA: sulfatase-like hydrolase/transferase, partial [Halioglobus sp.]